MLWKESDPLAHRAILNITFAIHPLTKHGDTDPGYVYSGKALKTINGDSVEDCLEEIKKFLKKSGFLVVKEEQACLRK
jgi:hypothetical protein